MLKKLRWKFILIITALLAGMLAAALAVQTVSAARQYREETERVLRAVLDRGEAALDPLRPFGGQGQDDELRTGLPAFYAVADRWGRVGLALGFNAVLDEETVVRAVEEALAAGRESGRLETLPDKLQEAAVLRLENPELNLSQLGALCDPPVSKSALNHRMRKLMELAGDAGHEAV